MAAGYGLADYAGWWRIAMPALDSAQPESREMGVWFAAIGIGALVPLALAAVTALLALRSPQPVRWSATAGLLAIAAAASGLALGLALENGDALGSADLVEMGKGVRLLRAFGMAPGGLSVDIGVILYALSGASLVAYAAYRPATPSAV